MKNDSKEAWNYGLSTKDWNLESMELDEMFEKFELQINEALDEVAPFKSFTVKSHFNIGIRMRLI